MPAIPNAALKNLNRHLPTLRASQAEVLHYCVVRLGGERGSPRLLLGERAQDTTLAALKKAWSGDPEVEKGADRGPMGRGTFRVGEGAIVVTPFQGPGRLTSPRLLQAAWKDLKKHLTGFCAEAPALDLLTRATYGEPAEAPQEQVHEGDLQREAPPLDMEVDAPPSPTPMKPVSDREVLALLQELEALREATLQLLGEARPLQPSSEAAPAVVRRAAELGERLRALTLRADRRREKLEAALLGSVRNAEGIRLLRATAEQARVLTERVEAAGQALVPGEEQLPIGLQGNGPLARRVWAFAQLEREVHKTLTTLDKPSVIEQISQGLASRDPSTRSKAEQLRSPLDEHQRALSPLVEELGTRIEQDESGVERVTREAVHQRAAALLQRVEALLGALEARALVYSAKGKAADARKLLIAQIEGGDRDALKKLVARPGGNQLLDQVMASLGGKAGTPAERTFVALAIQARFNITKLEGDLTSRALPRFYAILEGLPPVHTRWNDQLLSINRVRGGEGGSGHSLGHLTLNVPKVGRLLPDTEELGPRALRDRKVRTFDSTTLHEIGHSVDEHLGFMRGRAGSERFGGWRAVTEGQVLDAVAEHHNFFDAYKDQAPPAFLRTLLALAEVKRTDGAEQIETSVNSFIRTAKETPTREALLQSKVYAKVRERIAQIDHRTIDKLNPETDQLTQLCGHPYTDAPLIHKAIERVVLRVIDHRISFDAAFTAQLDEVDTLRPMQIGSWAELLSHPAVVHIRAIGLRNNDAGLWTDGDKGAETWAIGETVYQHAYRDQWVSYPLSLRKRSWVSDYQFRSPSEWFAELYAAHHQGKLDGLPHVTRWMKEEVDLASRPR